MKKINLKYANDKKGSAEISEIFSTMDSQFTNVFIFYVAITIAIVAFGMTYNLDPLLHNNTVDYFSNLIEKSNNGGGRSGINKPELP